MLQVEVFWVKRWRQHGPLKRWYPTTTLHDVTTQKTTTCNYLLTPCSRVLLEKLIVTQLVKTFPAFYRTRRFITVFTTAATGPDSEPDASSPHLPTLFLSNIIFASMPRSSEWFLPFRFCDQNFIYICHLSHVYSFSITLPP
jgi:hypothetical protein